MLTLKSINKKIRTEVNHYMSLYQGKGYLYIVFDDNKWYDSISIYTCKLNHAKNCDIYLDYARELNKKVISHYRSITE